ncbi:MAG: methyltransferase domain-containing protein [Pseudanabaena sp. ELA607]
MKFLTKELQPMNKSLYVQYGCGYSAPREWRNFDASPTLRFERLPLIGQLYTKNQSRFPRNVEYGDIVKGLPIAPKSCDGIYCSHVLEHLSLNDFRVALHHTHQMLRAGGIFRLVLPDLEYSVKQYLNSHDDDAALSFMRETYLGIEKRDRSVKGLILSWFGNSQYLWMWDYKSIKLELEKAGFVSVENAVFGDSEDPMFQKVEEQDRWENCLGVKCKKPDE